MRARLVIYWPVCGLTHALIVFGDPEYHVARARFFDLLRDRANILGHFEVLRRWKGFSHKTTGDCAPGPFGTSLGDPGSLFRVLRAANPTFVRGTDSRRLALWLAGGNSHVTVKEQTS